MQDLNDKTTGSTFLASEWNQVPSEIQNVIEKTGQTLSGADLDQLGKGIANYVANGDFYTDSGAANAYVLSVIGTKQSPTAYTDGMLIAFFAGNANTGPSTVNVAGLGVKSLKDQFGSDPSGGDIGPNILSIGRYDLSAGYFRMLSITTGKAILPIDASVASNALTVAINPTVIDFRSPTLTSGAVNRRVISSPISMTVSSGSTLGTFNGSAARLAVLAIDNAGTVEAAIVNIAGIPGLDETGLISTTAEGGAGGADSSIVIYSTTARANVPYRVVGFIDITEATAGTWATGPTQIQGAGGLSVARVPDWVPLPPVDTSTLAATYDVTGIPPWATEVMIGVNGISVDAADVPEIQLRDDGGPETTGYNGAVSSMGATVASTLLTQGFYFTTSGGSAAYVFNGIIRLSIIDPSTNTWSCHGNLGRSDAATTNLVAGVKSLTGVLSGIRLTTTGLTANFDLGTLTVAYR